MLAHDVVWPGGDHPFRLGLGELRAVQDKCDAGPELILQRIRMGIWKVDDLFEVLRFGLIGAGMDRATATKLVQDAFDRTPLLEFKVPALAVLAFSLVPPGDDPAGEPSPAGGPTPHQNESGSSAASTP